MTSKAQMNSISMQMTENLGTWSPFGHAGPLLHAAHRPSGPTWTRVLKPLCPVVHSDGEGHANIREEHRGHEADLKVRPYSVYGRHAPVSCCCVTPLIVGCCSVLQFGKDAGGQRHDAKPGTGDGAGMLARYYAVCWS